VEPVDVVQQAKREGAITAAATQARGDRDALAENEPPAPAKQARGAQDQVVGGGQLWVVALALASRDSSSARAMVCISETIS
jgi:hypothetical protein